MNAHETLLAERFALLLGPAEYVEFLDALQEVIDVGDGNFMDNRCVSSALVWNDTPQGHAFWLRYYDIQNGRQQ